MEDLITDLKIIVFRVDNQEFGLPIDQVFSIEPMQEVTSVPNMPEHMIGVIDLRGVITPVIDLRKALVKRSVEEKETTRIIAVNVEDKPIGLIVDEATDVMDISSDSIQNPNLFGAENVSFLLGIAKLNDRLLILINVNELLDNITGLHELQLVRDKI